MSGCYLTDIVCIMILVARTRIRKGNKEARTVSNNSSSLF